MDAEASSIEESAIPGSFPTLSLHQRLAFYALFIRNISSSILANRDEDEQQELPVLTHPEQLQLMDDFVEATTANTPDAVPRIGGAICIAGAIHGRLNYLVSVLNGPSALGRELLQGLSDEVDDGYWETLAEHGRRDGVQKPGERLVIIDVPFVDSVFRPERDIGYTEHLTCYHLMMMIKCLFPDRVTLIMCRQTYTHGDVIFNRLKTYYDDDEPSNRENPSFSSVDEYVAVYMTSLNFWHSAAIINGRVWCSGSTLLGSPMVFGDFEGLTMPLSKNHEVAGADREALHPAQQRAVDVLLSIEPDDSVERHRLFAEQLKAMHGCSISISRHPDLAGSSFRALNFFICAGNDDVRRYHDYVFRLPEYRPALTTIVPDRHRMQMVRKNNIYVIPL